MVESWFKLYFLNEKMIEGSGLNKYFNDVSAGQTLEVGTRW